MTAAAREWAWNAPLPRDGNGPTRLLILLYLAERCDKNAACWPSVDTIAAATRLDRKTVMRALRDLANLGKVKIERRHDADGHRRSNLYRLILDPPWDLSLPAKVNVPHLGLSPMVPPRPKSHGDPPKSHGGTLSNQEPFKNPSLGRARKRATPPPDHVELTDKLVDLGQSLGMDRRTVEDQLEQCLDWHRANGKSRTDWQATYRNWLKKSVEYQTKRNGHRHPAPPPGITWPAAGDFPAWLKFGQQHGIRPNRTESEADFVHRVRIHLAGGHRHA